MVQTFLYVQDYKRTCDIINIYILYIVKVRESSSRCYSFGERVRLEGRDVSGSDLIPLQYVFKDLVKRFKGHCDLLKILKNGGLIDILYMPYLYKSI